MTKSINTSKLLKQFKNAPKKEQEKVGLDIIKYLSKQIEEIEIETTKLKKKSWTEIKREFFTTKNLLDKLLVIEEFITVHKIFIEETSSPTVNPFFKFPFITSSQKNKKINPFYYLLQQNFSGNSSEETKKLDKLHKNLRELTEDIGELEYLTLEDAKDGFQGVTNINYKDFKVDYDNVELQLKGVLNDVFNIYMQLKVKRSREKKMFKRLLETYKEAIKAKVSGAIDTNTGLGSVQELFFQMLNQESGILSEHMINQMKLNNLYKKKNKGNNNIIE